MCVKPRDSMTDILKVNTSFNIQVKKIIGRAYLKVEVLKRQGLLFPRGLLLILHPAGTLIT